MAEFKYLPLFTDALVADCSHLSDEEFGLYMRVLITMWRSPGCRIPADTTWLERRFKNAGNALAYILSEYCQRDGAHWVQKRLLKEFGHVRSVVEKNRASAKSRWNKDKVPCERNAPNPIPRSKKEGGLGSAGAGLLGKGERLAGIIGWDLARWTGNFSRLQAWEAQGFDFELDIVPAVQEAIRTKRDGPPSTLNYFDKAIARYHEQRLRPMPEASPQACGKKSMSRRMMEAAARAAQNVERKT